MSKVTAVRRSRVNGINVCTVDRIESFSHPNIPENADAFADFHRFALFSTLSFRHIVPSSPRHSSCVKLLVSWLTRADWK